VIYDGQGHKMPILAVIGINLAGERKVLAFTVGERENRAAWGTSVSNSSCAACARLTCG
jgi:transposase-like protein